MEQVKNLRFLPVVFFNIFFSQEYFKNKLVNNGNFSKKETHSTFNDENNWKNDFKSTFIMLMPKLNKYKF